MGSRPRLRTRPWSSSTDSGLTLLARRPGVLLLVQTSTERETLAGRSGSEGTKESCSRRRHLVLVRLQWSLATGELSQSSQRLRQSLLLYG